VHTYHVDGFRFDLASILSRDRDGNLIPNPPVVESISEDPQLADTKIIAEAWDAAGAYQVGRFAALRWAEWNGRFRDDIRRFWRGEPNMIGPLATRLAGSSDLYQAGGRKPYHSINFITSHDGFTMNDLVSYNWKHNEANGEDNRDGDNNNYSCNYGQEGPTTRKSIETVRVRQIKNLMATNLLSQGVPMIVFGDECRRTQQGNNNAYCQDNAISWFDWRLVQRNEPLIRFVRALIAFRRREPTVRRTDFLTGQPVRPGGLPDASWFCPWGDAVDWSHSGNSLTCLLAAAPPPASGYPAGGYTANGYPATAGSDSPDEPNHHVLIMAHAGGTPQEFVFPKIARTFSWWQFVNTAAAAPKDIYPDLDGPAPPADWTIELESRSLVCYVARDEI
jgi:glycogen operon protein